MLGNPPDGLDDPDLQVAQSLNPVPHLQHQLSAVEAARHPWQAALPIAQMFVLLRGLGKHDGHFQREWGRILDGQFMAWAEDPLSRLSLSWREVWAAKGALVDLMDRRGMWYRVQGRDALDMEEDEALADVQEEIDPFAGEPWRFGEGDDDE